MTTASCRRQERLFTNLLSSMPLAFNLFGPFSLDIRVATRVAQRLCPDLNGALRCARGRSGARANGFSDPIGGAAG
jgi:hypothetical protein